MLGIRACETVGLSYIDDLIAEYGILHKAQAYGNLKRAGYVLLSENVPLIDVDDGLVHILFNPMLPGRRKGAAYYLYQQLDAGLARKAASLGGRMPRFRRAAVIFIHRYAAHNPRMSHAKNYDNLERACVLNTITKHLLADDNGMQIITMDITASPVSNCTEVFIMQPDRFMGFLDSLDIESYGNSGGNAASGGASP